MVGFDAERRTQTDADVNSGQVHEGRTTPGRVDVLDPAAPRQPTHPCLRLCRLRSSLSPILPRDGERVLAPLGLLELRRVPVCLYP